MLAFSTGDVEMTGPVIAFVAVLAGSLGIPIPSLAAVIYVGSQLAKQHDGVTAALLIFAAAMAGAVMGDFTWFMAGRRFGTVILGLLCRLSLSRDSCVRRTADMFSRRGIKILLVARFVPGLTVVTAPLAGISGVSMARFLTFAETGAAIWITTGLAAGFLVASQVDGMLLMLRNFGLDVGGAAVLLVLSYIGYNWYRRHRLLRRLRMVRLPPDELAALVSAEPSTAIIDARSAIERDADPFLIPGSLIFEDDVPAGTVPKLSHLAPVVIYCSCPNEITAAVIAQRMRRQGYGDVRPLRGGIDAWRKAGYPVTAFTRPGHPGPPRRPKLPMREASPAA